jgi:hypothetical protein
LYRCAEAEAEAEALRAQLAESEAARIEARSNANAADEARSRAEAAAAADAKELAKAKQVASAAEMRLAVMQSVEAATAKEAEGKDQVTQGRYDKAVTRAESAENELAAAREEVKLRKEAQAAAGARMHGVEEEARRERRAAEKEKAASAQLNKALAEARAKLEASQRREVEAMVGLALFTTLFCSQNTFN